MIFVVFIVIAGIIITGYLLLSRRDMSVLFEQLRPAEAAAVVAELEADAVPYELRDGGTTILTPTEKRDAVRIKLESSELPIQGIEGFELFDTSDLGLTEFAQRIKYQRALQGELARTIMKMEGVVEARIHLSIPERSVFRSERSPAKAAVTVLTKPGEPRDPAMIAGIQQLVAASVADLSPYDVVVLDDHGAVISSSASGSEASIPVGLSDLVAAVRAVVPGGSADVLVEVSPEAPLSADVKPGFPPNPVPRQLRVITPAPLQQDVQHKVSNAIKAATAAPELASLPIAFDAPTSLPQAPAPPPPLQVVVQPAPDAQTHLASPPSSLPDSSGNTILLVASLVIVALTIIGGSIAVLRASASRLSLQDQRRFAERLRIGLQSSSPEVADATR